MAQLAIQQKLSSSKKRSFLHISAWAGVIGPILFVSVFTLYGFLQPDYSSLSQMVSWLALKPNGWIQDCNFIIFGSLLVLFALGFSQRMSATISKKWLRACTLLLLISGAAWANDGIFVSDAPGASTLSIHGMMHVIGFLVIFSLLTITFFLVGRQLLKIPTWRAFGWYSIINGIVVMSLLFFLIYISVTAPQLTGVANRLLIIAAIAWYVVIGQRFLTLERTTKS